MHSHLTNHKPQHNKDFLIKKQKKLSDIQIDNPLFALISSEPVTPSKPTFRQQIKSSRNTIDYFIEFSNKNRDILQPQRQILPSLNFQSKTKPKQNLSKSRFGKIPSPEKDLFFGKKQTQSTQLRIGKIECLEVQKRQISSSKAKKESQTIQNQKSGFRMKPLIIQSRLMSKFSESRKPASHQTRNFRNHLAYNMNLMTDNQEQLFTFYPKGDRKVQMFNQFLDIQ